MPIESSNGVHGAAVWCDPTACGENQPSGGVDDGLKPVDEVTANAGRHRIAVVNLADRRSTN